MIEVTIVISPWFVLLNWLPPEDVLKGCEWKTTEDSRYQICEHVLLWTLGFFFWLQNTELLPPPSQAALILPHWLKPIFLNSKWQNSYVPTRPGFCEHSPGTGKRTSWKEHLRPEGAVEGGDGGSSADAVSEPLFPSLQQ